MLTGCEKLWKLLIEKNMKNSLFMNRSTKPMMIQGLCFSLCFFAFQLTEFTVNDRAEILFGTKWVNTVYSVGIACTALGFLSFSWLRRLFAGERKRKVIICIVGLFEQFGSIALVAGSCILSVMTLLVLFRSISFSILPQESANCGQPLHIPPCIAKIYCRHL